MAWSATFFCRLGGVNELYQVLGEILQPLRAKLVEVLHLRRDSLGHKLIHIIGTFILVNLSWMFFRANSISAAFEIIKSIFHFKNFWVLFDGSLYGCGLDDKNFRLMVIAIGILLFADICKHFGIKIREVVIKQDCWFRCFFIAAAVCLVLLSGKWGPSFDKANFIYFQF